MNAEDIVNQLLPVAFTSTSIYVVFIVFLLDKYVDLKQRSNPARHVFHLGGLIILVAFTVSAIATLILIFITLDILSPQWGRAAGLAIAGSIMVLFIGTLLLGWILLKDIREMGNLLD